MATVRAVCICSDHWPRFYPMHGPARYVQTLARGLVRRGVDVHVLTAHAGPEEDFEEDGYMVHSRVASPTRVLSRFQPGLSESYHLSRALDRLDRAHHFDVVEFTNIEGAGFWTARTAARPTVIRVHTTAFDAVRLGIGHAHLERGYARLERWTAHRATALVTHSLTHRDQIAADYGVPAGQIIVVPHGIVPPRVAPDVVRRRNLVMSVGAASQRKGVGLFLDAASRLVSLLPDVQFLWVGRDSNTAPGSLTWAEHARIRYPELDGRVEFRSGVSDAQLATLYGEATLLLCTSLYESFGLTLVEAMFAGLPVLAPATAAMAEVVRDGETGWLYPAEAADKTDALVRQAARVLTSPDERDHMSARAADVARAEYSDELMTTRMLEVYGNVTRV